MRFNSANIVFQINPIQSDIEFIQSEFSIRINPNESKVGMIRIKRDTKRFSNWFEMIRILSDADIGMNRNSSD